MQRKTRIADVAKAAGVSTATVSRALTLPERVGPETRARVLAAVAATGYRANAAARDLRSRRARAITLLAPNLANTFFNRIIAAVQEVAGEAGLIVQVSDSRVEAARLGPIGADGRTDGILLLDGGLDPAMVAGWTVPVVMVCEWMDDVAMPCFGTDNAAGIGLAVDHLAALGHRRVAFLGGPCGNVLSHARRHGFDAAMARHGLLVRPGDRLDGDFTMASGARAAHDWAAVPGRTGAVICASDESALGFISECDRMGIACPGDVSVVGFDDIEFSDRFIPPLTTVHQPRAALGRRAAETLVAALVSGTRPPDGRRMLPSRLIVRGSTAPI
ncbi:LacI family DNA-binding transcriptional regulator [Jannaschia sp. S6380]|uniref:LacI family DNA-binding transcriptional regulator n=1 Tax=Jannaschia sp. S6380 TaxID=2926408 RepID=UPI001FF22707|nr:LacI family DNA-binding transcriptional regulator [Jannaschia sp. S6380]MCK0168360.1 LacI family DNA-binding transcriptional regulator [Jannaschia sp. S6380]